MRNAVAILSVGALICGSSESVGDETPPGVPASGPTERGQLATAAQLKKHAGRIARRTARLRGLRIRRKISVGVLPRQEILKRIERKMDKEYTVEEVLNESAVLKQLGLLPRNLDYRKTVIELLKEQVAGFYDPSQRKLNLASWIPLAMQESAMAHEICHALQDQHFGLKRFVKPIKENGDQHLARAALVEGDCTGVMLEYALRAKDLDLGAMPAEVLKLARQGLVQSGSPKFQSAPRFLKETLVFPYLYGLSFMQQLRSRHSWRLVNTMFKRPPKSTEQILHYAKYWSRERPVPIRSASLPVLAGYKMVKRDVLGEFQLSLYLEQGVSSATARRAAAGWGGDLLEAYRKSPQDPLFLIHLSTWDSGADALEFANAERHLFTSWKLKAQPSPSATVWVYKSPDGSLSSVQLRGRHVLTLHGTAGVDHDQLQQAVWERWRVGGRRAR